MGEYKEHRIFNMLRRKGIITTYIVIIAIILIIAIVLLVKTMGQKEVKTVVYIENSNIDYKVYLKENEFFTDGYLGKYNQYIASLINYIEANFVYELDSPERGIDYKYNYKVVAEVNVKDRTTGNSLYSFQENIVEEKQYVGNTNLNLIITQPVMIDYNKYNDLITKFINTYDLANADSSLTINMYVNLIDETNQQSSKPTGIPVMTLNIPLTTRTMAIDIESKTVNANEINVNAILDARGHLFGAIVLIFIDMIIVRKLLMFIKDTQNEESAYNAKLRKIMMSYGSYIQKLSSEFNFDGYQILELDLFEDLLQIRETINKPVLMVEKELATDTYFLVPGETTIFIYEIKEGNFKKNRENKENN